MEIVVSDSGIVHYNALCQQCDFTAAIQTKLKDPADVRRAVRKHVKTTGHTVTIESGKHVAYSPRVMI